MQYGTQDVPHPSVINIPTTWRHLPRAVDPKLPGFSVESLRPYLHRPDRLGGDVDMGPSPVVFPATARRSKSCSSSICASANAPDGSRLGGRHAGPVGQPDQLLAVTGFPFPTPCPLSAAHWRRFRRYDTRSTRRRTATRARRWWAERCSTGGWLPVAGSTAPSHAGTHAARPRTWWPAPGAARHGGRTGRRFLWSTQDVDRRKRDGHEKGL